MNKPELIDATVPSRADRWHSIPAGLRERRQWVVAGPDKIPMRSDGLGRASATAPDTWSSFSDACAAAFHRGIDVGYVLSASDPFTCIDIDLKPAAPPEDHQRCQEIVKAFDSYAERSRGGIGVHIWVEGNIGQGVRRTNGDLGGVEVYSQERYIICTGNVVLDRPIKQGGPWLEKLVSKMRPVAASASAEGWIDEPEREADDVLLDRAMRAANGAKLAAHFNANWEAIGHNDHSAADIALLQMLSIYTDNNAQLKRLFLRSQLGQRDKATKRTDYLDRTIAKVRSFEVGLGSVEHGREVALSIMAGALTRMLLPSGSLTKDGGALRLVPASEIAARPPMRWIVHGVVPEVGVGAIFGAPGSGKSFLVLDLLAAIADGVFWFGAPTKARPVVYVCLEGQGGLPQRIRAYEQRGGPLGRIAFIEQQINLLDPGAVPALVDAIQASGMAGGVVCIDTLAASAPGMDENTSKDMGGVIAALHDLQAQLGGFVLVVHHTGKDASRGLRGWSGLNGALDCAIEVSRASDEKADARRSWEVAKSKDGRDGLFFKFELDVVELGFDADGMRVSSCAIRPDWSEAEPVAQTDSETDDFVWGWVKYEVECGERPSGRSLERKRMHEYVTSRRRITQNQLRGAIDRLQAAGRLVSVRSEGRGGPWLQAIDPTVHAVAA